MRGPFDDVIGESQEPPTRTARVAEAPAPRPKPPGGKALMRLLQLLESAGYSGIAQEAVTRAISTPASQESARRYTEKVAVGGSEEPKRRRRGLRITEAAEAAPAASAEEVGAAHLDAVAPMGIPVPGMPLWRSLGPWSIPNGQTYGSGRINVSGRVSAIAVDPSNPAHVLCGAANGGVWESRDRGGSWSPRTDYAATLAVGAIAFDPRNPRIVYCGTGEGNWWSWLGAGILRSTDGGTNWTTLCTTPFIGLGFYDLIVDPGDSNHLLAATTGGLYVSTNGGTVWTRRRNAVTWSLSIAPAGGAAAEILAGCADGLFRSTSGGTSWTAVALPGAPASFNRLAVAIARSNPAVAYAWGTGLPDLDPDPNVYTPTPYLWRRAASGTWSAIGAPPGVATGQSWYDWFLAVAPDRDNQIYCGAIDIHRGDLSGSTWTWRNLSSKGAGEDSIHPDQHAIAFEPGAPDTIYAGSDGGLFRSRDRGIHWQHCNNGLVISEFEYLAQDYGNARYLIGGTQDNGTERWTGSAIWEHAQDGDGGDCGVNRTNPLRVYHTYFGMSPERSETGGNFGSWSWIAPPVPKGEGSLFYPPFECSATSGDTIAIAGEALYISRNNGAAWVRLTFPSAMTATALSIPNGERVYVGTGTGQLYVTSFVSGAWSALSAITSPRTGAAISDVFVQPSNLRRIWLTYSTVSGGAGRVFRSDTAGASWTDCTTTGLPALPINAIAVDDANPARVWVCSDRGVYQTMNSGASWSDFSSGLPNAYVGDLVFQPHARLLRAATRNRGVWEIDVDGPLARPICGVQWTGRLAPNQEQRWFTFNWPATWHVVWTIMPTTVRNGAPELTWSVQVERANAEYATYWIKVKNLTATEVDFEGRYCILSRY